MSDPSIAIALLGGALGLALTVSRNGQIAQPLTCFACAVLGSWFAPIGDGPDKMIVQLGWLSIIVTSLGVHWPGGLGSKAAALFALNAGAWCGLLANQAASPWSLGFAGLALIAVAARWRGSPAMTWMHVLPKILAGWIFAIAALSLALPILSMPGYQSDHAD